MDRLTKGMYKNREKNLFGIRDGQISPKKTKIVHNSGWYNKHGEKLGSGDLSNGDFRRISRELKTGEIFIVLGEVAASWNFTDCGPNKQATAGLKAENPGIDYVAEHAQYVIVRKNMYLVDRHNTLKTKSEKINGLKFKIINPQAVKNLMTSGVVG